MRHWIEPRDQIYVKHSGFYFFTKNMSNNMNIVKNLKKMLQMHTKKSLRPKEELHVN